MVTNLLISELKYNYSHKQTYDSAQIELFTNILVVVATVLKYFHKMNNQESNLKQKTYFK
jgi:hypothetical protein